MCLSYSYFLTSLLKQSSQVMVNLGEDQMSFNRNDFIVVDKIQQLYTIS
jgi:hypothetical protein